VLTNSKKSYFVDVITKSIISIKTICYEKIRDADYCGTICTTCICTKIINVESVESVGFSPERLKRIDDAMNDWVKQGWMNGAVGMIIRDGKIVYYKAAGYNDIDAKIPLPKDDIFRIASQTKAITSVAVMMLYEEGKFLLDDPVSKYIPSFTHEQVLDKFNETDSSYTTVPAKRDVTIRDLLTHTSGIDYAQIGSKEAKAIYAKNNITAGLDVHNDKLSDAMNRLGSLPLLHQPGEHHFQPSTPTQILSSPIQIYLLSIFQQPKLKTPHFLPNNPNITPSLPPLN
jgi:CubicO group peptidase (beta-lactamase class C family)